MDQHPDVVGGHHDVRVRPQLDDAAAHRSERRSTSSPGRVDRDAVADGAAGERRVRYVGQGDDAAGQGCGHPRRRRRGRRARSGRRGSGRRRRPEPALAPAATGAPASASLMSLLSASDRVPKTACTLLPTSITPAAPSATSAAPCPPRRWSATSMRSRVMQASTLSRFSRPPKAAISCSARSRGGRAPAPAPDAALGPGVAEVRRLLGVELVVGLATRGAHVPAHDREPEQSRSRAPKNTRPITISSGTFFAAGAVP